MNRRAFFGLIAAGLAAADDPERLLWVPGRKLISIPKSEPSPVYRGVIITPAARATWWWPPSVSAEIVMRRVEVYDRRTGRLLMCGPRT